MDIVFLVQVIFMFIPAMLNRVPISKGFYLHMF